MSELTKKSNAAVAQTANQPERSYLAPEVDIYETEHGYTLQADMPGVTKGNLDITLENNTLTIVGHRAEQVPDVTVLYRESRPASFRRMFELDPAVDPGKIRAQMNQGVLTLELPKAERVLPKKIAVA